MSSITSPRTATPATIGSPTPPGLDGLRAMLDDWKEQGVKPKGEGSAMLSTRKDPPSTRKSAMESVYSEYKKMAKQEDKDLITRWTETLNILLTFAGLLSAVITAFLLASQSDLQPKPHISTNKILLHIAHQLDNTTDTSQPVENDYSGTSTLRALSYWHASLGCSLMSAFGSLLGKQWVLHYQSSPIWAKTTEEKCRLREIRAYGLSKWRMYAIIESLPVLLQAAVFLFYLGLVKSVHSTPILFRITIAITAFITTFFTVTFLAGAFFASCPFKSPVAGVFFKVLAIITFLIGPTLAPYLGALINILDKHTGARLNSISMNSWLIRIVTTIWAGLPAISERPLAKSPASRVGIIFWWLQESNPNRPHTPTEIQTVTDVCVGTPLDQVRRMAAWRGGLGDWCIGVFDVLKKGNTPKPCLLEADLICYLINWSVTSIAVIKRKLVDAGASITYSGGLYVCSSLRKGWTNQLETTTEPMPLPVEDMPPTTLAVYLRSRLLGWKRAEAGISYVQPQTPPEDSSRLYMLINSYLPFFLGDRSDADFESETIHAPLLLELPAALNPEYFSDLTLHTCPTIDATALAAIVLVPKNTSPHIQPMKHLINPPPLERLLQSLHRLSYYPVNGPPHQLVPTVVATASRVIKFKNNAQDLRKCQTWRNGKFAVSMSQLMHLGQIWWHQESGTDQSGPGARLVREIQSLMNLVIYHGITNYPTALSNILPISSDSLAEVFGIYAHPRAPLQPTTEDSIEREKERKKFIMDSIEATKLLNFALTSRYAPLPSWFLRLTYHYRNTLSKCVWSVTPSYTLQLEGRIQVLRQLIHNLGPTPNNLAPDDVALRNASLTTVVMGRDILLPSPLSTRYSNLTLDLSRLASEMTQTHLFSCELTEEMLLSFNKWDELSQALGDLLQSLEQSEQRRHRVT